MNQGEFLDAQIRMESIMNRRWRIALALVACTLAGTHEGAGVAVHAGEHDVAVAADGSSPGPFLDSWNADRCCPQEIFQRADRCQLWNGYCSYGQCPCCEPQHQAALQKLKSWRLRCALRGRIGGCGAACAQGGPCATCQAPIGPAYTDPSPDAAPEPPMPSANDATKSFDHSRTLPVNVPPQQSGVDRSPSPDAPAVDSEDAEDDSSSESPVDLKEENQLDSPPRNVIPLSQRKTLSTSSIKSVVTSALPVKRRSDTAVFPAASPAASAPTTSSQTPDPQDFDFYLPGPLRDGLEQTSDSPLYQQFQELSRR